MPVLGICNGFQVLCESHLLPGALMRNDHRKFVCRDQRLRVESNDDGLDVGVRAPARRSSSRSRTARAATSRTTPRSTGSRARAAWSPATSAATRTARYRDIAGITNARGNVVGLMPHPEHAVERARPDPGTDGLAFFTLAAAGAGAAT